MFNLTRSHRHSRHSPSLYVGSRATCWKQSSRVRIYGTQIINRKEHGHLSHDFLSRDNILRVVTSGASTTSDDRLTRMHNPNLKPEGSGSLACHDASFGSPDSSATDFEKDLNHEDEHESEFENDEPIEDVRYCREVEITSPGRMLDYITEKRIDVADITHLRLKLIWVPGHKTGEVKYYHRGEEINTREASELMQDDERVDIREPIEPASKSDIDKALSDWILMLNTLGEFATNLKIVHICWYGSEFCTNIPFVEALAKLKVAEHLVLHGTYAGLWLQYLHQKLKVPVLRGVGSTLIPVAHPVGFLDWDVLKDGSHMRWMESDVPLPESWVRSKKRYRKQITSDRCECAKA